MDGTSARAEGLSTISDSAGPRTSVRPGTGAPGAALLGKSGFGPALAGTGADSGRPTSKDPAPGTDAAGAVCAESAEPSEAGSAARSAAGATEGSGDACRGATENIGMGGVTAGESVLWEAVTGVRVQVSRSSGGVAPSGTGYRREFTYQEQIFRCMC